jgi:undecaprenyl-diphosphatase
MIKDLVMRTRPADALIAAHGFSFPSGHATAIAIFSVLAIYFFARKINNLILRETYIVSVILITVLVGVSRIYLGVHWLSDVVAGFSLGLFFTTLVILAIRYLGLLWNGFKVK